MEIKDRYNDSVIYTSKALTLGEDVVEAVKTGADLSGANLYGANLSGADLSGANLDKDFPFYKFQICSQGSIVGWKKIANGNILRLEIPADAARLNSIGSRKCRASYAIPVAVYSKEGAILDHTDMVLSSQHDSKFNYKINEVCLPDKFDGSMLTECSGGIHFFNSFEEARDY